MNIVVLEQNSIGLDIDLSIYEEFGNVTYYANTVNEVAERIKDADIVVANKAKLNEESLKDAKNVKLICEFATGYDNVYIEYCKNNGAFKLVNIPAIGVLILFNIYGKSLYKSPPIKDVNPTDNKLNLSDNVNK